MARITICDLCKERIKDDESKQGGLTLLFYLESEPTQEPQKLSGELCQKCTTLLRETISGDDPLIKPQAATIIPTVGTAPTPQVTTADTYGPIEKAVGPSAEEKASREPTKELLEDELVKVKSRFDRSKAAKIVAEQKGKCAHHFKSFRDGKIVCSSAPDGFEGELASFKGCGQILEPGEY